MLPSFNSIHKYRTRWHEKKEEKKKKQKKNWTYSNFNYNPKLNQKK